MDIINDRFQIIKKVYTTEIAQTFIAEDKNNSNKPVFIKTLTLGGKINNILYNTFKAEATVIKNLNHPGIPKYITSEETEKDKKQYYVAFEYIEGRTLKDLMSNEKQKIIENKKNIILQLADILIYLEKNNAIHKAITFENIILTPENKVYLTNFGTMTDKINTDNKLIPSEQKLGFTNKKSDQYSMGIVFLVIETLDKENTLPQNKDDLNKKLALIDENNQLKKIIKKMISEDSTQRFNHTEQIKKLIQKAFNNEDVNVNEEYKIKTEENNDHLLIKQMIEKEYLYNNHETNKKVKSKLWVKILIFGLIIYIWGYFMYSMLGMAIANIDEPTYKNPPSYYQKSRNIYKLQQRKETQKTKKIKLDTYKRDEIMKKENK